MKTFMTTAAVLALLTGPVFAQGGQSAGSKLGAVNRKPAVQRSRLKTRARARAQWGRGRPSRARQPAGAAVGI